MKRKAHNKQIHKSFPAMGAAMAPADMPLHSVPPATDSHDGTMLPVGGSMVSPNATRTSPDTIDD